MAATISEQFEHNENPACAGFLLSGDPTGVFANVLRHSTPVRSSFSNSSFFSFIGGRITLNVICYNIAFLVFFYLCQIKHLK